MLHRGSGQRREVAQRLGVAQAEIALGVPGAHQRLAPDRGEARGHAGHSLAHHARQLEKALTVEPVAHQGSSAERELAILFGQHPLVRLHGGSAHRPPRLLHELEPQAGLAGQLLQGVARPLRLEHPLDGKQRKPALMGGPAQLVDAEPLTLQGAQQLEPSLPRALVRRPVEQALGREIGRHGAHGHKVSLRPGPSRTTAVRLAP